MLKEMQSRLKDIWSDSGKISIYSCFISGVVTFFYFLKEEPINGDCLNEGWLKYWNDRWALSTGRWATPWIQLLNFHIISPVIMVALYILATALVSMLLIDLWKINGKVERSLVSVALIMSPAISIHLTYFYMATSYCLAMLLSVGAAYLMCRNKKNMVSFLGSIMLIIALGLYQAYINVFCMIIILTLLYDTMSDQEYDIVSMFQNILRIFIFATIGLVMYWLILKIHLDFFKQSLSSYGGADTVGPLIILQNLSDSIKETYRYLITYYMDPILYRKELWTVVLAIFGSSFMVGIWLLIKKRSWLLVCIDLIFIVALPVCMNVIKIIVPTHKITLLMSFQMQLLIPFTLGLIQVLKNKKMIKGKTQCFQYISEMIRTVLICMIVALCWSYSYSSYSTYRTLEIGSRHVRYMVGLALEEVLTRDDYKEEMPIVFVGFVDDSKAQEKNLLREYSYVKTSSVFWKARYEVFRGWPNYCAYYFGIDIQTITSEEYDHLIASEKFLNMPAFPDREGIDRFGDYYVIKLSGDNYAR